jgi:hypothetical protein
VHGSGLTACPGPGWRCQTCSAPFDHCQQGSGCSMNVTDCKPENCSSGCCVRQGNGVNCFQGTTDQACGLGGQICADCTISGLKCAPGHVCGDQYCGPGNCSGGCCLGNQCKDGRDPLACGTGGLSCTSCVSQGKTCQVGAQPGGHCGAPLCTSQNCSGCCAGDLCVVGSQDVACGRSGATCVSCAAQGATCQSGACR